MRFERDEFVRIARLPIEHVSGSGFSLPSISMHVKAPPRNDGDVHGCFVVLVHRQRVADIGEIVNRASEPAALERLNR